MARRLLLVSLVLTGLLPSVVCARPAAAVPASRRTVTLAPDVALASPSPTPTASPSPERNDSGGPSLGGVLVGLVLIGLFLFMRSRLERGRPPHEP